MKDQQHSHSEIQASFETLSRVATLSNYLAKQLKGQARTLAYRIKAEACSSLILAGSARVNGIWPDGTVALNLGGDRQARMHIRRSHLTLEAQAMLDQQVCSAPVVARLAEQSGARVLRSRSSTPRPAKFREQAGNNRRSA